MTTPVTLVIEGRDNSKGAFSSAGSSLSKIGQIAAGILASQVFTQLATGIVNFGKSVLNSAMESQQALADLNATIASTGGVAGVTAPAAQALADSLQKVTRFGDETIISAESMLLTFTKIGSDVFPAATEAALNMAEKFKTDPTQAAIQLGKALNDPIEGVGALRRVGVALTEEQEKQIKKFMAVNDIAGAQKIILGELETEFGGLARAMGQTFAGRMEILKNRFDEVKEKIGLALIPILEKLMDKFAPFIPIIEDFGSRVANVFDAIADAGFGSSEMWEALSAIIGGNALTDGIRNIKAFVTDGLDFIRQWWADNGAGIQAAVLQVFGGLKKTFDEITATAVPFISGVLGKLKAWFTENGPLIEATVRKIADNFTTYFLPVILVAWNTIRPIIAGIVDLILGLARIVMQIFTGDWAGAWETAKETAVNVFNALIEAATNLLQGLLGIFGTSIQEIAANVVIGWNYLLEQTKKFFDTLSARWREAWEALKAKVVEILTALAGAVTGKLDEIRDMIVEKVLGFVQAIEDMIGLFVDVGAAIVGGIAAGIENAWSGFVAWVLSLIQGIIDSILSMVGGGGGAGGNIELAERMRRGNANMLGNQRVNNYNSQPFYNFGTVNNGSQGRFTNLLDAFG